ncbi:glycosyltransferase [Halorubrum ezzemoulense]|uniref:glycosyltransferase n=1 Tax=Halorubrum ezzemoulense TaxID=337243 RepID=UPI00232C60AE|nr:glycosyltransferase [Halorubrum ezzemoulense]MDB9249145.1 glycosyltransferase [Halorubrum ezzemoulense]MDB9259699.1 glycosyltransferase [Halorubrum ezzemoulense]MDB9263164.1 glycosyltransferase [Halorubrum ezzemoulense]MDB9266406.1 glycosyltransferase [Halorubrum ezzemoulense]MDB9270060.1 glycosyltransferase [Halorubrum ezzemoulense]
MKDILVVHDNLMVKGGAEAVCMNTIEALQDQFNVELLTRQEFDPDELNSYYSTDVSDITVRRNRVVDWLFDFIQSIPGPDFAMLEEATYSNIRSKIVPSYDLIISMKNEISVGVGSIQYIHFPKTGRDNKHKSYTRDRYTGPLAASYERLCGFIESDVKDKHADYVANSEWTAEIAAERLGTDVSVVYPPVYTDDINPKPWSDRKNRILTIGRITPYKNIMRNIEIVSRLRDQGHSIHYDIVGPPENNKESKDLLKKVKRSVAKNSFISYHGEVSRGELVEMLSSYKYGLHGMDNEHFGIAVAELVAGGTIPFVPRGGGQCEVVGDTEAVLYDSIEEAVEKINQILNDEELQEKVQTRLPNVDTRFGRDRFQEEMRELVNTKLRTLNTGTDVMSR